MPRIINESYLRRFNNPSLAEVFATYGKLSGNLLEDKQMVDEMNVLMEQDDDFDPFGHLVKKEKISPKDDCVLSFSRGNDKLQHLDVVYVSLPAGYSCPFAKACKSMAHKYGGKFKDTGKSIKDFGDIRCYAASTELYAPAARRLRWRNFHLLQEFKGDPEGMADLIKRSLDFYESENHPIRLFRIHESGDFFSMDYFDAWILAAKQRPEILFYAYTKSLPLWKERKDVIPKNLRLIASEGGTHDHLIDKEQFRKSIIVKDKGEAIEKRLNIDINDFLAAFGDEDFALLLHGVQNKEGGMTAQAQANSKILKSAAKKFHSSPVEVERLLRRYTE